MKETRPVVELWHVAIPVTDLACSVEFYVGRLGFLLVGYDAYSSKRQAFIELAPGGPGIELFQPLIDIEATLTRQPDHLAFECADLTAFRAELLARGLADVPEIDVFDNGVQYLGLEDPDGIPLEFFAGRKIYEAEIRGANQG